MEFIQRVYSRLTRFPGQLKSKIVATYNRIPIPWSIDRVLLLLGAMSRTIESIAGRDDEDGLKESVRKRNLFLRRLWCWFITSFVIFGNVLRFGICWFFDSPETAQLLGDISSVLGGQRELHLMGYTNYALQLLFLWLSYLQEEWKPNSPIFNPFIVMRFPEEHAKFGLTEEMVRKMRARFKLSSFAALSGVILFFPPCAVSAFFFWYKTHGLDSLLQPWTFSMIVLYLVWCAAVSSNILYTLSIFHLTCYMFFLRFRKTQADLVTLMKPGRWSEHQMRHTLDYYADTCRQVERYNKFWSRYVGVCYITYTMLAALLLFIVLFSDVRFSGKLFWFPVLIDLIVYVAFLAYSGDIVSRNAFKVYVPLNSLAARFSKATDLSLKVRK